jgi:hypothetical protein
MTRHIGPRYGSSPRLVLDALGASATGTLPYADAQLLLREENRSVNRFEALAMRPLEAQMLATNEMGVISLLPAGSAFLQQLRADVVGQWQVPHKGEIAQPRTVPAFKPLDLAKLMRGGPSRPGMDDLRDCPSLMCDKRISSGVRGK